MMVMRRALTVARWALIAPIAISLLLTVFALTDASAAGPRPRGRDALEPAPRGERAQGRERPAPGEVGAEGRRARRGLDGTGSRVRSLDELTREEKPLHVDWTSGGCSVENHYAFVKRLLALENKSDLMSLEIWGDSHEYEPYDRVIYYMRVPRAGYVTLFWIGPKNDVFVSFENLKVPADRDVSVNPDAIVVPPLGREQWVAIATLEPFDFPCFGDEKDQLAWVDRATKVPHGVGRWEVWSKPKRSKEPRR